MNNCLAAKAVTLALQPPVRPQALTPKSQTSQMPLHKVIAFKAKALTTAQKQNLGVKATLVVNGTRILIYMASGDPLAPEKNPTGLL